MCMGSAKNFYFRPPIKGLGAAETTKGEQFAFFETTPGKIARLSSRLSNELVETSFFTAA